MEENTKLRISKDFSVSIESESAILLSMKEGWYIKLNSTGSYILKIIYLNNNISFKSLISNFSKKYTLTRQEAKNDLNEFLNILISEGVILNE